MFKKAMILATVISGLLTAAAAFGYHLCPLPLLETLAITLGTCFYHFAMRMFVGAAWSPFQKHDPTSRWFEQKPFEKSLYKALRVKTWKQQMPTYDPASFEMTTHTLEEIAQAMCHSELVHETIAVLSFVPLLFVGIFGAFPAFLITSLAAAAFDMMFVMMQRYNRPRVMTLIKRQNRHKA